MVGQAGVGVPVTMGKFEFEVKGKGGGENVKGMREFGARGGWGIVQRGGETRIEGCLALKRGGGFGG